MTNDNPQ